MNPVKNPVTIRNVTIGRGRPKICVPITGQTRPEILKEAGGFSSIPADLAEWRADWYEDVFDAEKLADTAKALREALGELPLLFTFRTKTEGGEKAADDTQYKRLNLSMAESGCADLIDVELFSKETVAEELISAAHEHSVKVIGSSHDFHSTPSQEEIVKKLCHMQKAGADIAKIAVMPRSEQDVLTLLSATLEMSRHHADCPVITMSMSETGLISRLAGESFGSAVTFGAASKASAPGQIGVRELRQVLDIIHGSLG